MSIFRVLLMSMVILVPVLNAGPPPTYSKPSVTPTRPVISTPKPVVQPATPKPTISQPKTTPSKSTPTTPSYTKPANTSTSTNTTGVKPQNSSTNYGNQLSQLQAKNESKASYQKGTEAKTSYVSPTGKPIDINPRDQKVVNLRNQITQEKWVTHETRRDQFYSSYNSRPMVIYPDSYNPWFHYWLLDQSIDTMALFLYHHRYDMQDRYNAMLLNNAQLQAKINALEMQRITRDSSYVPTGMPDADLLYNTNYLHAVYNPAPVHLGRYLLSTFIFIACLLLVLFIIYLVFIKEWS